MRYILFAGHDYEASGGADDILGVGDTIDDLEKLHAHRYLEGRKFYRPSDIWAHIFDTEKAMVVRYLKYKIYENETQYYWSRKK